MRRRKRTLRNMMLQFNGKIWDPELTLGIPPDVSRIDNLVDIDGPETWVDNTDRQDQQSRKLNSNALDRFFRTSSMYAACYVTANACSNSNVEYNTELLRICNLHRQGSTGSTMSIGLSILETSVPNSAKSTASPDAPWSF